MRKIIVVGPALSQTGYGEQCRFALRSLMSEPDRFDVYLKPTNWGNSSWLLPSDPDRNWIDNLIRKTGVHIQSNGSFDMSLQVTIPNEWEKITPINVGYTAGIESTKISGLWIEKSRIMDKIITISNHSRDTFVETVYEATPENGTESFLYKCETPVDVVHYPVRKYSAASLDISLDYDFNFLTVSQWGPRKNLENTIRWWVEEFKDDEVGLIVKTNLFKNSLIDRDITIARLRTLLREYQDRKCKVYLLHGYMTNEEMTGLYTNPKVKCMVSLTHGEGFGLPLFEAAYNNIPIIAPDWSGHKDFLHAPKKVKKKNKKATTKIVPFFATVDYELKPIMPESVWENVLDADAKWCYAKEASYKNRLRAVYKDVNRFKGMAKTLKSHLEKNFTAEAKYSEFCEAVYEKGEFDVEDWLSNLDVETHD